MKKNKRLRYDFNILYHIKSCELLDKDREWLKALENLISMCSELLLSIFDATRSSAFIQYLFVSTFGFDDNSAWVVKGGRKLNKCPESESSGNRYGVGEINRTVNGIHHWV